MQKYCHIVNNTVTLTYEIPDGKTQEDCFVPSNLDLIECAANVECGYITSDGGKTFTKPSPPEPLLEDVKKAAKDTLLANMNTFIATLPDGSVRYDMNFQIAALQYAIAHGLEAAPIPSLNAWRMALFSEYTQLKASIDAAETVDAVQTIDVSVEGFEAKFGVSGTASADPNVTTEQLMS